MRKKLSLYYVSDHFRYQENNDDDLRKKIDQKFKESAKVKSLGDKFESDKKKIEMMRQHVEESEISSKDKDKLIEEINDSMEKIRVEYENSILDEWTIISKEILEQTNEMEQICDELSEQADSLRTVTMEVVSVDTSAAAEKAEKKREEIDIAKQQYEKELAQMIEDFDAQKNAISDY